MLTVFYAVAAAVAAGLLTWGLVAFLRAYRRQRGERVIVCPETHRPAIVEVDATHAALTSLVGRTDMRLKDCSRWPFKKDCGQECLLQIDSADEGCLVRGVIVKWYRDKSCIYCRRAFGEINWTDHEPALMNRERKLLSWADVTSDRLFETLETCLPVCWNCYVAQSFRAEHPEMVVDRDWRGGIHAGR